MTTEHRGDTTRFEHIAGLFRRACDLSDDERAAFLRDACSDDPSMSEEVERLVRRDRDSRDESPVDGLREGLGRHAARVVQSAEPALPEQIGRYRVLAEIGRGGMGVVYRAEQEHPRRVVAVKVLRAGLVDSKMRQRFEHEAQILGRLQHPGIAQIHEAGAAGAGLDAPPFLAMELVEGRPLTRFAEENRLDTRARMRLWIAVCQAVQHAHQKGVIHRDLKPANILVTAAGQPKILDFGVARATATDLNAETLQTGRGQLLGTLPYMSPEQVAGDAAELDTRSDVYSLGVIGFELLACRLPLEVSGMPVPQAVRTISEQEPATLGSIDRSLAGDLATIVQKALEKDREQRYQSARQLAEDLDRYLNNRPIWARPPSAAYQLRKFAQRNKGLVAGLTTAALVLVAALIGMTWLNIETGRAKRDALRNEQIASAANRFLDRMLAAPDPYQADFELPREVRVLDVLDRASEELERSHTGAPEVEAELRLTLGKTYLRLGEVARASAHLEQAYHVLQETRGLEHPRTISALQIHALAVNRLGELDRAEPLARQALELSRQVLGPTARDTIVTMSTLLGNLYDRGRVEEALELAREALELATSVLGEDSPEAVLAIGNLALALLAAGQLAEAEERARLAVQIRLELDGEDDPGTLDAKTALANVLWQVGKLEEAEELTRDSLWIRTEVLGESHPGTLGSMNDLIMLLVQKKDYAEARALRETQLALAAEALEPDHHTLQVWRHNHALFLYDMGNRREGLDLCLEVLEAQERALPPGHPDTLRTLTSLGNLHWKLGDVDRAEEAFGRAHDLARTHLPARHWLTARIAADVGSLMTSRRRFEEAEAVLLPGFELLLEVFGEEHHNTRYAAGKLRSLYTAWGVPELAERYRVP